jgi:outer membrane protein OmpA-like peptidoglycan-associated protein
MRHPLYVGVIVLTALVVSSGCATRGSVRALQDQMQQQVRALDGQVQQQGQQLAQQAQHVQQQGQQVQQQGQQVEQHGQQLAQQGQQLQQQGQRVETESGRISAVGQRMDDLDGRLGRLARHEHVTNVVETLDVHFASGRATLDDAGMTRLRSLARQLRNDRRVGLELVGYTDPEGSRDKNLELSQRRVETVRRYLVEQGVSVSRIAAVGLGPLTESGIPDAKKRRVTINLTVPELMTSTAPATQEGAAALPGKDRGQSN